MADYHFYTNPQTVKPQKRTDAYGPIDQATATETAGTFLYQLGSAHLSGDSSQVFNPVMPPAIAVCDGRVCILEARYKDAGGPGGKPYYNLIFKPNLDDFAAYPPIKYIIYRMIHHDSLFKQNITSGAYELLEGPSTNPMVQALWRAYNGLTTAQQSATNRPSEYNLGKGKLEYLKFINSNDLSKIYLDDLFYYNFPSSGTYASSSLPLPVVQGGTLMANFKLADTTYIKSTNTSSTASIDFKGFSVDFLLDSPGFNPTLKELFEFDNINQAINQIKLPLTGTENVISSANRFNCLNYIDPTAFYGEVMATEGNRVIIPGADTCNNAQDLYKFLMVGKKNGNVKPDGDTSNLYNRNRVYLDIRDRYRYPYGFFRDKDGTDSSQGVKIPQNNLALSIDNKPPVPVDYNFYQHKRKTSETDSTIIDAPEFKWPILILDYNTGVTINYNNTGNNPNRVQPLGFPEADPGVAGMNSIINVAFPAFDKVRQDNFIFFDNNVVAEDSIFRKGVDSDRFQREKSVGNDIFCAPHQIRIRTTESKPIAGYKKIRHIEFTKEVLEASWNQSNVPEGIGTYPIPLYLQKNCYLDFVFPVEMKDKWKNYVDVNGNRTNITASVWQDQGYFDNTTVSGRDFMGYTGIAHDKTGNSGIPNDKGKAILFAFDSIPVRALDDRDGREVTFDTDENHNHLIKSNVQMEFSITERASNRNRFYNEIVADRIRAFNFTTDTIKPTNPNNPDQNSSVPRIVVDSLVNTSSFNQNDENNVRNDVCFKRTEDFIAMGIPKDDYEEIVSTIYPQQFLNHSGYIKNTPVFFGFKPVDSGVENGSYEWVKFEITLDGYRMVNGVTSLYRHPTGKFIYENIDTINMNNYIIPDIEDGSRGFDIDSIPPLNPAHPPAQSIVSNIYLAKSPDLSYAEFIKYSEYFLANIRHVYNTTSNKGLTASVMTGNTATTIGTLPVTNTDATYPVNTATAYYQQVNPINADGVKVFHASPIQFKTLGDNEVILMVQRNQPAQRSAILSVGENSLTRRQGTMCYKEFANENTNPYREENTAAHEFGHILSLADRYTTIFKLKAGDATDLDPQVFSSVTHYLSAAYDPNYTSDYRWTHNLMGLGFNVPKDNTGPVFSATDFPPDYWTRLSEFASSSNDINQFGNVFITPRQWQYVYDEACATIQPAPETMDPAFNKRETGYFVPSATSFEPFAFTGYDSDNITFISDNGFDESSSNRLINHTMNGRKIPTALAGYFDPYTGGENERFLRVITQVRDYLFFLLIGRSLSNLQADHRDAINKVTNPNVPLTIPLSDTTIQTVHLDYSAPGSGYGEGDSVGNAVWNHLGPKAYRFDNGNVGQYRIYVENDSKINVTIIFTWNIEYTNRLRILTTI